jgi:hypothetical protein
MKINGDKKSLTVIYWYRAQIRRRTYDGRFKIGMLCYVMFCLRIRSMPRFGFLIFINVDIHIVKMPHLLQGKLGNAHMGCNRLGTT